MLTKRSAATPSSAPISSGAILLGGVGIGWALSYILDPDNGRRRRHRMAEKAGRVRRRSEQLAGKAVVDLEHRLEGAAAETRSRLRSREPVANDVLVQRVRSKLGQVVSHPRLIDVRADDGVVRLSGPILKKEAKKLIRRVRKVRGVEAIQDDLERHTDADIQELEGGRARGTRTLRREHWPPALRLCAAVGGASLAAGGALVRGAGGAAMLGAGLAMLARAAADRPLVRLVGLSSRPAFELTKHIRIERPVEDVFEFFWNLENLPRFMSHLRTVRIHDDRTHWVLDGPAGVPLSWDAKVTVLEPNQEIAWRSLPGSIIESVGHVRFQPEGENLTRVEVHLAYRPPAGAIGHAVASLFGTDPKSLLDDDLLRLKGLLEVGRTTAHHRKVSLSEIEAEARA